MGLTGLVNLVMGGAGVFSVACVGLLLTEWAGPRLVTRAVSWWALHGVVVLSSWGLA